MLFACRRPEPPPGKPSLSSPRLDPAAFSGERALAQTRDLVAFSPRDAGTTNAGLAARHLAQRLREAGLEVEIDEFQDDSPIGPLTFRNVLGRRPGTGPGVIVLGSHYDTKAGIGDGFEGANDSGSSSGVLLEMAAAARRAGPLAVSLLFVFFDGEECIRDYGRTDGLHGSRRLAGRLAESGAFGNVAAGIVLDMIGDTNLTVELPRNSSPFLCSAVLEASREENARDRFRLARGGVLDDHAPFLAAGMPAIDLIDFDYGSAPGLNDYWHTPADRMDKLSASSLQTVGRVAIRTVNRLLDTQRAPPAAAAARDAR